jgi:hypothetical protein
MGRDWCSAEIRAMCRFWGRGTEPLVKIVAKNGKEQTFKP